MGYGQPWGYLPQWAYSQQSGYQYPPGYAQQMAYARQACYTGAASLANSGGMLAGNQAYTGAAAACGGNSCYPSGGYFTTNGCSPGMGRFANGGGGNPCADPCYQTQVFGEFIYLRPRNAEVAYGVAIDGPIVAPPVANPIQVGPVGVVDPDYSPGFRVGFTSAFDEWSDVGVIYTHFESSTSNAISTNPPDVIRSLVSHPSSQSAASDFLWGRARYDIDYDLVDVDYHCVFASGKQYSANCLVGVRYCGLAQDFRADFANNGTELVTTDIKFDGGGVRFGLEGERRAACSGFLVYGTAAASFIGGEFRARYFQGESVDRSVVDTSWQAGRIVTILDLELGIGWTSASGCLRFTTGYLFSAWFNTVKTDEFINAVHANDFVGLGDTLTFDGLTARAELRF